MNSKGRLYIAYGSNLNLEQMKHRCPTAEVVGVAELRNWRLWFRGGQHDISSDFPGMKRAVEAPKLHRVVAVKETVQVKEVVAAAVGVLVAVFPVALVPTTCSIRRCKSNPSGCATARKWTLIWRPQMRTSK